MLLPTKGITPDRALLAVGGNVLEVLSQPMTVSRLWHDIRRERVRKGQRSPLTYDWFVLALDFLYMLRIIELDETNLIRKATPQ
jgi:ABC-three component (ABC-3C) system Middle Component 6